MGRRAAGGDVKGGGLRPFEKTGHQAGPRRHDHILVPAEWTTATVKPA
jgi:hypothetical protein